MEATKEVEGLLDKIRPPRLEDAGLEDCALPPDAIKEAFLKAAAAVKSIISGSDEDETEGHCVDDPWPTVGGSPDALVGIAEGLDHTPGACATEKGGGGVPVVAGDEVAVAGESAGEKACDQVVAPGLPESETACVDGLQGLEIDRKVGNNGGKEGREG